MSQVGNLFLNGMKVNTSKKYYKKTLHLLKEYGEQIKVSNNQTPNLFVGNGGMLCGRRREEMLTLFNLYGNVAHLIMAPKKSFSILIYNTEESATKAKLSLTNYIFGSNEDGPVAPLYLYYLESPINPSVFSPIDVYPVEGKSALIDGLLLQESFISEEYEKELIDYFQVIPEELDPSKSTLKHRSVKHFGFEFLYGSNNIDRSNPLKQNIPEICKSLLDIIMSKKLISFIPDQLTVNQYEPGQGIPPHIDTHSAFEDGILSLSLNHQVTMEFVNPAGKKVAIILPQRSLLVMTGESRYLWTHGITPRRHDIYYTLDNSSDNKANYLNLTERGLRISLTFRKVLHKPCSCIYRGKCDSQNKSEGSKESLYIPDSNHEAINLEGEHVYKVYEEIAEHFSDTRHSPWPRIKQFLLQLQNGSLVADVGCGNGKYLGVNPKVKFLGSDRSVNLVNICDQRGFEVLLADCLHLPYRMNSFDASICIAVIHHLSTEKRRLQALKELVRITSVQGVVLVYVWALEQKFEERKDEMNEEECKHSNRTDTVDKEFEHDKHTNRHCIKVSEGRNVFQQQDLLIPWHLKQECEEPKDEEKIIFHRFYHVFKEGELEALCKQVENVEIDEIYFDKGNWCAVLRKVSSNDTM